ncbi:MAG: gliding motility-associated transport system permease protein [Acidimicrobiaceae bacterium]|nr:gliding motility-associated transport system permease protein [Acidimicrobiaceae bacterium]
MRGLRATRATRATWAVVGKEMVVLWTSPLPYVVGALLHIVLGTLYVNQLQARGQALAQPLFPLAGFLLVALVPILTMRTLADEARTGSLDLLHAVPVPARAIVVGKWLASWATTLVVLAPATLFAVLLAWWGNPDRGPIIAGFAGLALLSAAVAGVGLLASSLTSSQPVAAMVGFFVALLLWFAHVGSETTSAGPLLAGFSISERLRSFAGGAIDSSDVGFFVLLTAAALVAAATVVQGRRLR